jgi:hypothetical protein
MSSRVRKLALGALLLGGAGAALWFGLAELARHVASREAIEARLERMLGRDVRLGGASLSVWPLPAVQLEDVALEPGVQIGALEVDLSNSALLSGQFEPDEIVARRVRFTLERGEDGSFGFGGGSSERERRLPVVSNLDIQDASVTWIDRSKPGLAPLELAVERFVLSDLAPGGTATLELVAHPARPTQARVELDARVGPLGEVPALRGAPVSGNLRARGVDVAWVAPYLPPEWDVELPSGGTFDLAATLGMRSGGDFDARVDLNLPASPFRVAPVQAVGPARFVGNVARRAGRLAVQGDRVEAAEVHAAGLHARELRGTLALADGAWELALRPRTLTVAGVDLSGVQVSGSLRPGAALQLSNGALRADAARFGRFSARRVTAAFAVRVGVVEISDLQLDTAGGQVGLHGRIQPGTPPKLALDARFENLDVIQLTGERLEGVPTLISGRGQISGAWTGEGNWLAPLSGSGAIQAQGGTLFGATLLAEIARALIAAVPGTSVLPGRERPPRQTSLESVTAHWVVRDGRLRSDDISVVTGDYRARGAGRISHDGSLRIDGDVVLSSSGVALVGGLVRAGGLSQALRLPAIPIQVRGTLAQPEVRADVGSLPMASVRGLLGLPARAGDAVVGVGQAGGAAARGVGQAGGAAARGVGDAGRRVLGLGRRGESPPEPEPEPTPEP